jgi:hypothetical protein
VLRDICLYTLLMLALAFAGTALARPRTIATAADGLPASGAMSTLAAPAEAHASARASTQAAALTTP